MAIKGKLGTAIKLELPRNSKHISGNASIHSMPSGGYRTVIAVTKHPEEAPIRTDIVREFNSRYLLTSFLRTRAVLKRAVKTATLPAGLREGE